MGNLYRFVEPVLLFLLRKKGRAHGYDLASDLREYSLTDAEIEIAALYRTLRQLEENGCVTSAWKMEGSGPARRLYVLTRRGEQHLQEWVIVLDHMSRSMKRFIREARAAGGEPPAASRQTGTGRRTAARRLRPGSGDADQCRG